MRESAVCSSARASSSCTPREPEFPADSAGQRHIHDATSCLLLVIEGGHAQRAIVRSLRKQSVTPQLTRSVSELKARLAREDLSAPDIVFIDLDLPGATGDDWVWAVRRSFARAAMVAFGDDLNAARAARLLGFGVPSLRKPVTPRAFTHLALELSAAQAREVHEPTAVSGVKHGTLRAGGLVFALESYASVRALSIQQRLILGFYLSGENDKQIAQTLSCSEATVYEHWRRMGKKAGGVAKASVISDFHRFLGHD
jgi:DNA-binding NarL/FixJ family response regulator